MVLAASGDSERGTNAGRHCRLGHRGAQGGLCGEGPIWARPECSCPGGSNGMRKGPGAGAHRLSGAGRSRQPDRSRRPWDRKNADLYPTGTEASLGKTTKLQGGPGTPPTSQGWCRGSCWEPVRWPWPRPGPLWLGTWLSEWPTHRTAMEGSRATWNSKHWKRPTPTVSRHAPLPLSVLGPRVHSGDGREDRA